MYISLWIQQILGIRNLSVHKSKNIKWRWKWKAKVVTHTRNLCSEFVLCIYQSKCTQTAVNTHSVNTHPEQWATNAGASREQLGVRCLAQGSHLSHGIEGGERALYIHSPHWQSLPDRDSNLQPFDYESDSLPLSHDFPNETLLRHSL